MIQAYPKQMKEILLHIVKPGDGFAARVEQYFKSDQALSEPQNHPSVVDQSIDDPMGIKASQEFIGQLITVSKDYLYKIK